LAKEKSFALWGLMFSWSFVCVAQIRCGYFTVF